MPAESILIIDDSVDNLDITKLLLELDGYVVHTAEGAIDALELLQTLSPDLILMDVQMPEIDGLELTRRLRQDPRWDQVKIIALTAYAMKRDEERAREAGCDGYITKPIDTRTFAAQVRAHFTEPRIPHRVEQDTAKER